MEYVAPRNVTNGSTAADGFTCRPASMVTSYNNTGIVTVKQTQSLHVEEEATFQNT
jgi:hypothetical protein